MYLIRNSYVLCGDWISWGTIAERFWLSWSVMLFTHSNIGSTSWSHQDIQLQRAMFYGWQRAVLVFAPVAGRLQCCQPFDSSFCRWGFCLCFWFATARILGYAKKLPARIEINLASKVCIQRRLQQRLESAASHVFRVTSSQQAQVQTKCIRNVCTHVYNLCKCI